MRALMSPLRIMTMSYLIIKVDDTYNQKKRNINKSDLLW